MKILQKGFPASASQFREASNCAILPSFRKDQLRMQPNCATRGRQGESCETICS